MSATLAVFSPSSLNTEVFGLVPAYCIARVHED